MRSKTGIFLMVGLVVSLSVLATMAQAEEPKAQLYLVDDVVVKPSMLMEHEAAMKEMIALTAKHNYPFPWYAYSTDDFHYYYVMPVEDFADVDKLFNTWGEVMAKAGNEFQAMFKNFFSSMEYYKDSFVRHRPDLSYMPEKPRLTPEEAGFMFWGQCYVIPGKQQEFEEIFKKWVNLYKSKNIPDAWDTFMGDIGTDMPFYFWGAGAKSPVDFWTQDEKGTKEMGEEEVMKLGQKTMALLRKFEIKTGRFRPELSYMPEEK